VRFPARAALLVVVTLATACTQAAPSLPGTSLTTPDGVAVVFSPVVARGRIFLLHGLGSVPTQAASSHPIDRLIQGLAARGWQVVVAPEPFDGANQYAQLVSAISRDAGTAFRATWLAWWDWLTQWANTRLGRMPTTVTGVSWGGLLALTAACERPTDALGLIIPVVDVSALDRFHSIVTSALPGPCPQLTAGKRVWLGWGTRDTVAGSVSQPALAARLQSAGVTVSAHAFKSEHVVTSAMVGSVLQWVTTLPAPPAPSTTSSPPAGSQPTR
jgi:predicted esterase